MTRPRLLLPCLLVALALLSVAPAAYGAPTSELIDRALQRGEISDGRAALLRLQALEDSSALPDRFRGDEPDDGTLLLLQAREALPDIESDTVREQVRDELIPERRGIAGEYCWNYNTDLPDRLDTEHFRIDYRAGDLVAGDQTIQEFADSLEHAWDRHMDEFGWAAPPFHAAAGAGGRLHVRLDPAIDPSINGLVSNGGTYAGAIGDNPNTPWNDLDAQASCMVLRPNYAAAGGGDAQLRGTSHHEFHHMVQYGMGAGFPNGSVDLTFMEGSAKWIEDELDDDSNRNHRSLWLDLRGPMGHYTPSPYTYWLAIRGWTERYGQAQAGGAEQVMQRFWEKVSQGTAQMPAIEEAVAEGADTLTLDRAFHETAIANRFMRECGGAFALPLCFTEASLTMAANSNVNPYPPVDRCGAANCSGAAVPALGTRAQNTVLPDYTAARIRLPAGSSPYRVAFSNNDPASGPLWATIACDTGSSLRTQALGPVVNAGRARRATFDPAGCGDVVLNVTNPNRTGDNPSSFGAAAPFDVATGTAESPLNVDVTGAGRVTSAPAGIDCGSDCLAWYPAAQEVTLTPAPASGKVFRGWSGACTGLGACTVTMSDLRSVDARFGDVSATTTSLSCSPATVAPGAASTCTAVVADTGTPPVDPSGTVAFSGGGTGSFSGNSCTLAGTPTRQCSVSFTPTGDSGARTVTATYGGGGPHTGSTGDSKVTVSSNPIDPGAGGAGTGNGGTGGTVTPIAEEPTRGIVPDTLAPVFGPLAPPATKIGGFLRRGLTVPLSLSEPAAVQAKLTVDRATAKRLKLAKRVIARGSAAAGAAKVLLKAERKAAKKLKRARRVRATLTVVATDAAGNAATRTLAVTLKR